MRLSASYIARPCAAILCLLGMEIATMLGLAFPSTKAPASVSSRTLAFTERVACQRAIEEVYWRHRIWPKENSGPKPLLDAIISQRQIQQKVEDYVRKSELVTDQRGLAITASELQAEMDRIAQHTKQPEMLRELSESLGNDPFVIAECLARPIVAERFVREFSSGAKDASLRAQSRNPAARLKGNSTGSFDSAQDDIAASLGNVDYRLPEITSADCSDDTWTATSVTGAPDARAFHSAVWTGNEMIVWGGLGSGGLVFATGGRYNPDTESWIATTTTNAPTARVFHSAVWTGAEMIVWGGYNNGNDLNSGGRYNPALDTWTATTTINAPIARESHTAVWTGTEMIVWGGLGCGSNCRLNSGGRYNPSTDSWTATSTINAPEARWLHSAEWTGSEMIVWGGSNQTIYLKTGAKYNPTNNTWTPTSTANAPLGRVGHTSIWSGSEMMVWGGTDSTFHDTNTGGRYNPTADSWSATSTNNAPSPRDSLAAVWTGSEMIVWAGIFCCPPIDVNTGGRYNAATDSWTPTSTANVPFARDHHTAVWTGSEMIVWGGYNSESQTFFNTGGRYCAQSGPTPTPTPTPGPITLSASGRKIGGINTVRLTWSGATSSNIDVYRDRALIVTTANDGLYVDSTGETGRARYTYRVCEAGTSTCSNNARVTFRQ